MLEFVINVPHQPNLVTNPPSSGAGCPVPEGSDADEQGTKIERYKIMNGSEWRATTTLKGWPTGIEPTDEHRRVFRHCLRATVCTGMNKYGAVRDYELSTPMGRWYPVPRAIEYSAYRGEDTVFMRDEEGLHECTPIGNGNYEVKQETVPVPPLRSHPIPTSTIGGDPTGRITSNSHHGRDRRQCAGDRPHKSDAAVHVEEGKGGVCWRAIDAKDKVYSERFPIEVPRYSYSYRQEMIGLFYALKRALKRFPALEVIRCYCDNQAGIYKAQWPTYGPGEVTGLDMDVILAIRELVKSQEEKDITFYHVRGHTDEKLQPGEEANRIEVQNVECDRGAEECKDERPVPFQPLPGSKCVIRVANKWVTTRVDTAIQDITSTAQIRLYLLERLQISEWELDDIDTEAGTVRPGHQKCW
eukprot:scaffold61621_cov49-Cyclotella_meneghiniana.AAC.1